MFSRKTLLIQKQMPGNTSFLTCETNYNIIASIKVSKRHRVQSCYRWITKCLNQIHIDTTDGDRNLVMGLNMF